MGFSDHHSIKTDPPYWAGERFALKANSMINASMLEPTIDNLQFWGIMACLEYGRASGSKAWIYGGLAVRICQELGINKEETLSAPILNKDGIVDTVAMALRRRVFWSCLCIDKYASAGTNRPQCFDKVDCDANTPSIPESLVLRDPFQSVTVDNRQINEDPLMDVPRYYLKLLGIFGEVNKFMTRAKNDTSNVSWPPVAEFGNLDALLRTWKEKLPEPFQFSQSNVEYFKQNASQNYINLWLSAHVVWCTSIMVLHRGSLAYSDIDPAQIPKEVYRGIRSSIDQCQKCVDTVMPIFQALKELCGYNILPYMGYSAYIFATVLMTATFSRDAESCRKSHRGLIILYELIEGLKPYWPMCERLAVTTRDLLGTYNRMYEMHHSQEPYKQEGAQYSKVSDVPRSQNNDMPSLTSLLSPSGSFPYNITPQQQQQQQQQPIQMQPQSQQQPFSLLNDNTLVTAANHGEINFNSCEFLYDSALFGQIMFDATSRAPASSGPTAAQQIIIPVMQPMYPGTFDQTRLTNAPSSQTYANANNVSSTNDNDRSKSLWGT
ncbi:hypothetical protein EC973_002187 [Apophysomyces ossiformis]|uniref:Xylanolytic transcriptional activator regulatory domain-containing protein n=1 Tax=Apophysomyces ossiformis TaxID=679940 RepID=A0A8H7ETS9_9FUNG|nr:hypothetical protein EC973_002187 [Apophysomyces ossiformis]